MGSTAAASIMAGSAAAIIADAAAMGDSVVDSATARKQKKCARAIDGACEQQPALLAGRVTITNAGRVTITKNSVFGPHATSCTLQHTEQQTV